MTSATTLVGKIALVTGAASGIGEACAERFVREGAVVIATDVANEGAEIAERIGAEWRRLDVADPTDWDYLTASIANDHGRLDLVHLNAGIRLGAGDVSITPVADYLRLIGINQHGVFLGLRATIPLLEAAGGGMVVVTASRAGIAPLPNDIPYAMAKHAIVGPRPKYRRRPRDSLDLDQRHLPGHGRHRFSGRRQPRATRGCRYSGHGPERRGRWRDGRPGIGYNRRLLRATARFDARTIQVRGTAPYLKQPFSPWVLP